MGKSAGSEKTKAIKVKIISILLIVGSLVTLINLIDSSTITGLASLEDYYNTKDIDLTLDSSKTFMLENEGDTARINSLRVSGELITGSTAWVFLVDNSGREYLVYSTQPVEDKPNLITGFSIMGEETERSGSNNNNGNQNNNGNNNQGNQNSNQGNNNQGNDNSNNGNDNQNNNGNNNQGNDNSNNGNDNQNNGNSDNDNLNIGNQNQNNNQDKDNQDNNGNNNQGNDNVNNANQGNDNQIQGNDNQNNNGNNNQGNDNSNNGNQNNPQTNNGESNNIQPPVGPGVITQPETPGQINSEMHRQNEDNGAWGREKKTDESLPAAQETQTNVINPGEENKNKKNENFIVSEEVQNEENLREENYPESLKAEAKAYEAKFDEVSRRGALELVQIDNYELQSIDEYAIKKISQINNTQNNAQGIFAPEQIIKTEFENECVDTCALLPKSGPYKLVVKVEPGTVFKLTSITYTLNP